MVCWYLNGSSIPGIVFTFIRWRKGRGGVKGLRERRAARRGQVQGLGEITGADGTGLSQAVSFILSQISSYVCHLLSSLLQQKLSKQYSFLQFYATVPCFDDVSSFATVYCIAGVFIFFSLKRWKFKFSRGSSPPTHFRSLENLDRGELPPPPKVYAL